MNATITKRVVILFSWTVINFISSSWEQSLQVFVTHWWGRKGFLKLFSQIAIFDIPVLKAFCFIFVNCNIVNKEISLSITACPQDPQHSSLPILQSWQTTQSTRSNHQSLGGPLIACKDCIALLIVLQSTLMSLKKCGTLLGLVDPALSVNICWISLLSDDYYSSHGEGEELSQVSCSQNRCLQFDL